jgi:hypothetical protein
LKWNESSSLPLPSLSKREWHAGHSSLLTVQIGPTNKVTAVHIITDIKKRVVFALGLLAAAKVSYS